MGCLQDRADGQKNNWAINEAKMKDVAVVCVGNTPLYEGEEGEAIGSTDGADRTSIGLPTHQVDFVKRLAAEGVRIVLVVTGGSPIDLSAVWEHCAAILLAWYPGEQGGHGVAEVLFGDVAPAGRMPITVPRSLDCLPAYRDYSMDGRGYRFMRDADIAVPFGFGLSYTTFAYRRVEVAGSTAKGWTATVTVANTGARDGVEVVQLYHTPPAAAFRTPRHRLVGFARVMVRAGTEATVTIVVAAGALDSITQDGSALLLSGSHTLVAAGCAPGTRATELGASAPVQVELALT